MEKIIFVSDIFTPYSTRSSTQLLNFSIIQSISKQSDFFCVGIYDNWSNKESIIKYFDDLNIKFGLLKSKFNVEENSNFKNLTYYLKGRFLPRYLNDKNITLPFPYPDKIVVSVPSIEAAYLAIYLKHKYPKAKLITIWTDVIAYNFLNNKNDITFKRKVLRFFESYILKKADVAYYLGDVQKSFQMEVYPKYSCKMKSYWPSFYPYKPVFTYKEKSNVALYFGHIDPEYRDLTSLIASGSMLNNCSIKIVGTGCKDYAPKVGNNVFCNISQKRISDLTKAIEIEYSGNISICFMNKNGFSLPGKLFYYTDLKRPIIVIRDGNFAKKIEDYLIQFKRYVFCDNNPESIANTINDVLNNYDKYSNIDQTIFEPIRAYNFILSEK